MTKKPKKIALANDLHPPPCQHQTGFTTADKIIDFDPNFDQKEVPTELPIIEDNPENSKTSKHSKSNNKSRNPSKRQPKEVPNQSKIDLTPKTKQVPIKSQASKSSKYDKEIQDLLQKYKRSTNQSNSDDRYLSIIALLNYGLRPSEISTESGVPKTTLQNHLNTLKKQGVIYKAGYGVWKVVETLETAKKRSTKSIYVAKNTSPSEVRQNLHMFIPDSVRAHAFLFTLQVPHDLRNWNNEKREQYLNTRDPPIEFKRLNIAGGGQRLIINGRKTHLTNKSIVIYDRASYFAEKPIEAKSNAIHSFISIIKKLERTLHVELTIGSDYKFRVARQHYALIKNAIAHQYNAEGEKLEVRSEDGSLWFLIDNSFNLDEAEGVHAKTGMTDTQKVLDLLNSVKATGETMYDVRDLKEMITGVVGNQQAITGNQMAMAENTESHIEAIQDLGAGVQKFNSLLEKLFRKLDSEGTP